MPGANVWQKPYSLYTSLDAVSMAMTNDVEPVSWRKSRVIFLVCSAYQMPWVMRVLVSLRVTSAIGSPGEPGGIGCIPSRKRRRSRQNVSNALSCVCKVADGACCCGYVRPSPTPSKLPAPPAMVRCHKSLRKAVSSYRGSVLSNMGSSYTCGKLLLVRRLCVCWYVQRSPLFWRHVSLLGGAKRSPKATVCLVQHCASGPRQG